MQIKSLKLENFQGIKELDIDFSQNTKIYGDNATGKTTIFNAFTWLLFDKPSTGAKNYSPKTKTADGEAHYLDHGAEMMLVADDGQSISLKKVYKETYTKKRGSITETFTGHTTDYYVNGVPNAQKDYNKVVESLVGDVEISKTLTMLDYFPSVMDWQKRREILFDICGDVSNEDIFSKKEELNKLKEYLDGRKVPELKKIATVALSEINKELSTLPARIDEALKAAADKPEMSAEELKKKEAEYKKEEERLISLISSGSTNSEIESIETKIRKLREENTKEEEDHRVSEQKKSADANKKIEDILTEIAIKNNELILLKQDEKTAFSNIEWMKKTRQNLVEEHHRISSMQFDESSTVCPTCHREYDGAKIDEMKASFNLHKSTELEAITERGKKEASKELIAKEEEKAKTAAQKISSVSKEIEELEEQKKKAKYEKKPFAKSKEYEAREAEIESLKVKVNDIASGSNATKNEHSEALNDIREKMNSIMRDFAKYEQIEAQQKRAEELKTSEKRLSKEYEMHQEIIGLCEEFTKVKVSMIDDKINSKFSSIRFRLFKEQINGGLQEDCEALIETKEGNLVPYSFANNAAKINAGIEIISTLSKHYGISIPIFVDNAESVTNLYSDTDTQIIQLIVSEADKILRIEN
ncbi:MAG: AAA family ATPase [Bacillota bacterium]|nr:AAA family ATPase [Bacillota bacterium]